MCEMIDEQVATLLLIIIILVILVIMVGDQAAQRGRWRSLVSKRAGQQRERSTVDTGDHYDHYDGDDKVDGDDVPDADGDDQVNLTAVRVITAVLTQGRFAGGQGQEYAQVPSFSR